MKRNRLALTVALTLVVPAAAARAQEAVPKTQAHVTLKAAALPHESKGLVPIESAIVTGAPYTAEVVTESVQVLADGNRIVHRTTGRIYRDGQGRTRRETDRESGQPPSVFISDPVSRTSYNLDPEARVAWKGLTAVWTTKSGESAKALLIHEGGGAEVTFKSHADPNELDLKRVIEHRLAMAEAEKGIEIAAEIQGRHLEAPGQADQKTEKLPARQIEGVMAEGVRTTRTIPAGAIGNERPIEIVSEEWRSPDLGVLVLTVTSDPRTGESTYKLLDIVRGEPGAANFEVPAGYRVEEGLRKLIRLKHE